MGWYGLLAAGLTREIRKFEMRLWMDDGKLQLVFPVPCGCCEFVLERGERSCSAEAERTNC